MIGFWLRKWIVWLLRLNPHLVINETEGFGTAVTSGPYVSPLLATTVLYFESRCRVVRSPRVCSISFTGLRKSFPKTRNNNAGPDAKISIHQNKHPWLTKGGCCYSVQTTKFQKPSAEKGKKMFIFCSSVVKRYLTSDLDYMKQIQLPCHTHKLQIEMCKAHAQVFSLRHCDLLNLNLNITLSTLKRQRRFMGNVFDDLWLLSFLLHLVCFYCEISVSLLQGHFPTGETKMYWHEQQRQPGFNSQLKEELSA